MIYTVKGFGIVNKAEVDVFLELSCFFGDPVDHPFLRCLLALPVAEVLKSSPMIVALSISPLILSSLATCVLKLSVAYIVMFAVLS